MFDFDWLCLTSNIIFGSLLHILILKYIDVSRIVWYHKCEDGILTHGMFDLNSISQKSLQAPHISKYIKESIEKILDRGLNTRQISEEHKKFCFNAQSS
jgi:hypothetical protein